MSRTYCYRAVTYQHLWYARGQAKSFPKLQSQRQVRYQVVQGENLPDVGYRCCYKENPEEFFGLESGMLFDGIKDPYVRASIIEYLQFMRLTEPFAYKPKEHIYT